MLKAHFAFPPWVLCGQLVLMATLAEGKWALIFHTAQVTRAISDSNKLLVIVIVISLCQPHMAVKRTLG